MRNGNKVSFGGVPRLKGSGRWREGVFCSVKVVVDPSGRVYFGTSKEISLLRLSPFVRRSLSGAIKVYRYVYRDDKEKLLSAVAEKRREHILMNASIGDRVSYDIPAGVSVKIEASARRHGETAQEWLAKWLDAAFEAEKDDERSETGKREIPLTKREREFLERIENENSNV